MIEPLEIQTIQDIPTTWLLLALPLCFLNVVISRTILIDGVILALRETILRRSVVGDDGTEDGRRVIGRDAA